MAKSIANREFDGMIKPNPITEKLTKLIKIFKRKNFVNIKTTENKYKNYNDIKTIKRLKGLNLKFKGTNNKVIIGQNCVFKNSKIEFWGDNIIVEIGDNCFFSNLDAIFSGYEKGNTIRIGNNFFNTDKLQIFAGGNINNDLYIGNDCLFSRQITIYAHDGHNIYDNDTKKVINIPIRPVQIGDKVWLGHGVTILKNTSLPNNTIVGAQSVISKEFTEENTIIAGNNPKVVRRNICWKQ